MRRLRLKKDPTQIKLDEIQKQLRGRSITEIVDNKQLLASFLTLLACAQVQLLYHIQRKEFICAQLTPQKSATKITAQS
jgi:hypothetical protein